MKWKWKKIDKAFPDVRHATSGNVILHLYHHSQGWDAVAWGFDAFVRVKVRNVWTRRQAVRMIDAAIAASGSKWL